MVRSDFTVDDILFEEGESITECSSCSFRDDPERFVLYSDSLSLGNILQSSDDVCFGDFSEVESERSRSDGLRDFLDLRGGEDELHMTWWFFEDLQKGIEGSS